MPSTTVPTTMAAEATITGTLEAIGGPAGIPDRPLYGQVTATESGHPYSVSVGTDGRYAVTVPAGTYTVVGRSPLYQGGAAYCYAAKPVTVGSGSTAAARVVCDEV
jgi:hypothetical protein